MAHIRLTEIGEAEGLVKQIYEDVQRIRGEGRVSNLLKGFAAYPELLRAKWELMKVLLGGGNLSRQLKESIMVALSEINGCKY
ncbi:MAG: hypothetical protein HY644_13685 [Acidobacteria bacterium]|nr:hypothetical protein [Acidobacteriota bacterium]